jgi:hypothetical protein
MRRTAFFALIVVATLILASVASARAGAATYYSTSDFGLGDWPGHDWRPFSDASPFNTPYLSQLTFDTAIDPNSATYVSDLVRDGGSHPILTSGQDYYNPDYYGDHSDPAYTIHDSNVCDQFPVPCTIHAPAGIQTTDGSDHGMQVYWDGYLYNFEGCTVSGFDIVAVSGRCSVRYASSGGLGYGGASDTTGYGCGLNAAGFCGTAGRIRPREVMPGLLGLSANIPHALFASMTYDSGTSVCPADKTPDGGGGSVPEGTLFQLDPSYDDSALPPYEHAIAEAAKYYGIYVANTSEGGGFAFSVEGDKTYTQFTHPDGSPYRARWPIIAEQQLGDATANLPTNDIDWAGHLHALTPTTVPGC